MNKIIVLVMFLSVFLYVFFIRDTKIKNINLPNINYSKFNSFKKNGIFIIDSKQYIVYGYMSGDNDLEIASIYITNDGGANWVNYQFGNGRIIQILKGDNNDEYLVLSNFSDFANRFKLGHHKISNVYSFNLNIGKYKLLKSFKHFSTKLGILKNNLFLFKNYHVDYINNNLYKFNKFTVKWQKLKDKNDYINFSISKEDISFSNNNTILINSKNRLVLYNVDTKKFLRIKNIKYLKIETVNLVPLSFVWVV